MSAARRRENRSKQKHLFLLMKKNLILLAAFFVAFTPSQNALAHISYTNRNFGTLVIGAPASSINNQTMSSAFGWADATDSDWGDSHRGRFFRFTLSTTASVMVSVQRNSSGTGTLGTFLPAISVYSGLAQGTVTVNQTLGNGTTITRTEALAHDGSALSVSARGSAEGSLQTLANFSIGNDPTYEVAGDSTSGVLIPARLASFTYIGHAADGTSDNFGNVPGLNGDGNADGFVTATLNDLAAGDYSLFVGGANYAAQLTETGPTYPTYGVDVSVQAVPEPSTWALIALGFGFLAWRILHRKTV
jgi:hypothetical protein